MSPTLFLFIVAAVAAFVAGLAMPVIRRWAMRSGALVASRSDRWHTEATPALGGIGIFAAVLAAVAVAVALGADGPILPTWADQPFAARRSLGLLVAGFLMFGTGLVDDLRDLSPTKKLTVQVVAASALVGSGFIVTLTGITVIDVIISLGWFVAVTNAMNLLDNMNGLAGGVSAIAASYLGVLLVWDGLWFHAAVAFALAGACAGFLIHNYPRGRIFMGDSGSLFIGILLAGLGLSPAPGLSRGLFAVLGVPMLILAIPILDTVLVTASRLAEGRPLSKGGRDHASHRLVAVGIAEPRAVRFLWLFAALSGAVALALRTSQRSSAILWGGVLFLGLATLAIHLLGIQVRERVGGGTLLARILAANQHWPALAIALDVVAIGVAYYGAYLLRWEGEDLTRELAYFRRSLAVVIPLKIVAFGVFRVYRNPLRHFSVGESERLVVANVVGSASAFFAAITIFGFGFSRGILAVDALLCVALTLGYRLSVRVLDRQAEGWHEDAERAVILGSDQDALLVLGELKSGSVKRLKPVCVLDPAGYDGVSHLRGMAVRSGCERCRAWLRDNSAAAAFVVRRDRCIDPAVSRLVEDCLATGIPVHFLDISLALGGQTSALTVRRPAGAHREAVGGGR